MLALLQAIQTKKCRFVLWQLRLQASAQKVDIIVPPGAGAASLMGAGATEGPGAGAKEGPKAGAGAGAPLAADAAQVCQHI